MKQIVIGIDQSYKNTGVSIAVDNVLKKVTSIQLEHCKSNSERREVLRCKLTQLFHKMKIRANENDCSVVVVIERIRLQSQGFLNINYIKSIGALNSVIVDTAENLDIKVYSVDTRSWKAQIIGTSKPSKNPKFAMEPEKYPTFEWLSKIQGGAFTNDVMINMSNTRKKKNIFELNGVKYKINDDACDSAGIALYYFSDNKILEEEH